MLKLFKVLLLILLPTFTIAGDRIVVIGAGAGEIVSELGFADQVIATDLTSRHLPEYKETSSIGYIRSINAENILSIKPTLIIAEYGTGPKNQLDLLKSSFKKTYVMPTPNSLADVYDRIKYVAKILNIEAKANKVVSNMKIKHKKISEKLKTVKKSPRIMAIMVSSRGVYVAGDNSSFGRVIKMAKGDNVFADVPNYQLVTDEAIINTNPDIILYFNHGADKNKKQKIYNNTALKTTNAVKNNKVYEVDTYLIVSYGPRTIDAIDFLVKKFYPNKFK